MVLQRRLVIVHDGQGVKRLDQVVVVDAQVLKVVDERCVIGSTDLSLRHDVDYAAMVHQHVGHLHHRRHMRAARRRKLCKQKLHACCILVGASHKSVTCMA